MLFVLLLQSYLETMRFLSDTSDTMMYLCDLASNKIYFALHFLSQSDRVKISNNSISFKGDLL